MRTERVVFACVALLAVACAKPPKLLSASIAAARGCRHVPYIAGELRRVFVPAGTRYVNDHTLVVGPDGTWHLYAITNDSPGEPEAEHQFLHATAPSPLGPWTEQPDALVADPSMNERVLWAPYVVESSPRRWTMFYYADLLDGDPTRGVREAESTDLWHWRRVASTASPSGRPPGGRDPFVLRLGERWLLYSVGSDAESHGQILVTETRGSAFDGWSPPTPVLTDPEPAMPWRRGNVQSPFVVVHDGAFYLFVTRRSPSPIDYARTDVFCSDDPHRFAWRPITVLHAHAAEVVSYDGRDFVTSAGWTKAIGEDHRGLSIAPLAWADRQDAR